MSTWSFISASEAQTLELGIQLGRLLEQPALILLQGDLGAGKSVLARGIARGLGVDPRTPITSPTFTMMNHYSARLDLYHFDLYRLSNPDELIELGFDDFAFGPGVALVEWPERLNNHEIPGLWIVLENLGEDSRKIILTGRGEVAMQLFDSLRKAWNG
ncbi:MAG: tRNA (adenosine(37)-N6)-threonylcarbamoyltransferase complex ATPase subunit type 1 TsaE [Desulfuromonadales bacterium]|nr:tRNA (adenosine(37)-N6)-threonylcarbamoyltransferase complex ATPase subunit type 1 TsaE [Desulfuromonadales bacterium]